MPANAGVQLGAGWSSSQVVKKIASKTVSSTSIQLGADDVSCGTLVIADATAGVYVGVGTAAQDNANTVELALGGSIYLHGIPPSRVYVKRVGGSDVTVRYVTYV